jgi:hypothetical protein
MMAAARILVVSFVGMKVVWVETPCFSFRPPPLYWEITEEDECNAILAESGSELMSEAAYAFEMRCAGLAKRAGRGLLTITTKSTRHLSQHTAPAVDAVADSSGLEQPQELGFDFHGNPWMALAGTTVKAGGAAALTFLSSLLSNGLCPCVCIASRKISSALPLGRISGSRLKDRAHLLMPQRGVYLVLYFQCGSHDPYRCTG